MFKNLKTPFITNEILDQCFNEVPIKVNNKLIKEFILNGQDIIYNIFLVKPKVNNKCKTICIIKYKKETSS